MSDSHAQEPRDTVRSVSARRLRRTAEQEAAHAQLKALTARFRYRVRSDAEGFPFIPARYGQIEWADSHGRYLAVYSDRSRLFEKLWAIPGVRRHQTGDTEMRAFFPPEALEQVAGIIKAHRKAGITSSLAKNVGSKTAFGATARRQKARSAAWQGQHPSDSQTPLQEAQI